MINRCRFFSLFDDDYDLIECKSISEVPLSFTPIFVFQKNKFVSILYNTKQNLNIKNESDSEEFLQVIFGVGWGDKSIKYNDASIPMIENLTNMYDWVSKIGFWNIPHTMVQMLDVQHMMFDMSRKIDFFTRFIGYISPQQSISLLNPYNRFVNIIPEVNISFKEWIVFHVFDDLFNHLPMIKQNPNWFCEWKDKFYTAMITNYSKEKEYFEDLRRKMIIDKLVS